MAVDIVFYSRLKLNENHRLWNKMITYARSQRFLLLFLSSFIVGVVVAVAVAADVISVEERGNRDGG